MHKAERKSTEYTTDEISMKALSIYQVGIPYDSTEMVCALN